MTSDTTAGLGRWRDGGPSRSGPSRSRAATVKWVGVIVLSILLMVAAGTVVWIIWQSVNLEKSRPEFVGFFVSDYQRPRVPNNPWTRLDGDALRHTKLFNQVDAPEHPGKAMTREVMGVRLESLAERKRRSVAVVYLSCRAMVDAAGTIQLLGADSDPSAPDTLLPLHDALAAIKNYPAENKLLVLDIIWSALNALDLGGTTDGVADLIRKELGREDDASKLDDPHLMVLAACSPGEVALWSERLGQSVFGHYFLNAFHDPEADTDHDQAIWVKELASYVSTKVDEWARQHRGRRQRPILIGAAKDFRLATLEPQKAVPRPKNALAETAKDKDKVLEQEKAPEKQKPDEKAKASGTNKTEGEAPAKAKGSDKDTENPVGPEARVYPQWLAEGWKLYEQWANGAEVAAAPRVFRCLETSLLRWEQEWRSGLEPREIQARLDQSVSELSKEMEQALKSAPRVARSVGQARAFGQRPDSALVKRLKELLERRRKPELLTPPDQVKNQLDSALKSFLATLKGKTRLDLAMAMVEATGDERFDPETVKFLDSLVVDTLSGLDVVDLRLLRQLARRAGTTRPDVWDDETAKTAWVTVVLAEEANNRPYALPWIRELLDDADALRHEAEVLLLPEAAGFASRDQISQTWQRVQEAYAYIDSFQLKIRDARLMLNRARAALPPMIPYLEATGRAERELLWLEAANTAHQLDVLLARPATPTRERLESLGIGLSDTTQKLDSRLKSLLQPFETGAVRDLVRRCGVNQPRPGVAGEVEAILTTPFPPFSERIRLWEASLVLDERLGELSVPTPESTPGAEHLAARTEAARDVATRRAGRISALLGLAGTEPAADQPGGASEPATDPHTPGRSSDADSESHLASLSRTWGGLARVSRFVLAKLVDLATQTNQTDEEDRPGWIAPAFALELSPNPIRQGRDRDELAAWRWLAEHYRHRDLDLHHLVDPDRFYDIAALEYPDVDRTSPENALELGTGQGSPGGLSLSGQDSGIQAAIRLLLRGADDAAPPSVSLKVLAPADPRLRVPEPPPAEVKLQPQTPRSVSFRIKWEEDRTNQEGPPPAGLIVQARLPNQRPYHLLVPLTIVSDSTRPRLVLRADPTKHDDISFDRLLLRTLPVRQNLFLFVRNPSPMSREVIVEIVAGKDVIIRTPKAIPVKGNTTVPVPGFGDPVLKATDPLPQVPQDLKLRLRDSAAGQVLDEQPLQPVIAAPLEYLEVVQPRFIPARPGEPNRLEMTIRALHQMTGPGCRVNLIVPSDKDLFPAFREVPKGHLEGTLEPGAKSLHLYAEDIKLDPAAKEEGRFQVTIDGLQRALWYKTRFPAEGEPQPATIDRTPRVRFQPEVVLKEGQPAKLRVQFAVDNAPPGVRLAFVLGRYKNGKWVDDLTPWGAEAKRRHLGFDPRGEGGALQFEASIEDWTKEFDIPGIRGRKILYAYLLDARGREELDKWGMEMILDDVPPQITLVDVPKEIDSTSPRFPARVTVKATESKIKDIAFIVNIGTKGDFTKAETKTFPGKPSAGDPDTWEATLPVPQGSSGKLVVSARATNGVGLTDVAHGEIAIREPMPEPPKEAAKPAEEKPGAIEGKVTENDVAQPGLIVYLIDPNAKDKDNPVKDQKKTAPDGAYSFLELKPGRYTLVCEKDATRRRATKDVTIPSGQTVRQDLDLLLP